MDHFYIQISGFTFKINLLETQKVYFKKLLISQIIKSYKNCILYTSNEKVDLEINISDHPNTLFNRKGGDSEKSFIYIYSKEKNNIINTFYNISLNQFIHILTEFIINNLYKKKGFLLHAASSKYKDKVNIFTGPSGAGKSTVISFLRDEYPAFGDDLIIIRWINKKYYAYQIPIIEKNSWIKKGAGGYEIKRIFFLQKARHFSVKKIKNKEFIISILSRQLWTDKEILGKHMENFLAFVSYFDNFYYLYFDKEKDKLLHLFEEIL